MNSNNFFNFSSPSREELEAVRELAESNPEMLDGRDIWVFKEFLDGGEE